ncbi:MAG: capsule assembly Wzi family protein [Woeseiaceae bacterium]|nr:capsule assembly Wzi family protein [Woeseiaceae bacterium]
MAILSPVTAIAGPAVVAGDTILRHDIQLLADRGILTGPTTTWPLAWGPILSDLRTHQPGQQSSPAVQAAIARLKARADWETRTHALTYSAEVSAAENPLRIRGYENTPRDNVAAGAGLSWTGDRLTITLKGQAADPADDNLEGRADGSMIGIALGNWAVSLNTLDRWWGPGWDGSLILSNNARPMPAVSLDRNFTDAFDTKWLSWLGPWDVSVMMGELESDRVIPNAQFFGMRFNFRPIPSLEVGLSRTAQWCGDGRPCDAGTFADLLLGRDNRGDAGIDTSNEPGNQMAGVDVRWSQAGWGLPTAVYGQFIGEDEAGGFPSRYLGLLGVEATGLWNDTWSWRWFGEFAGTTCQFHESSERFNCAYNHSIYRTGYRHRGRPIGHGADNDARLLSTGLTLVDTHETQWRALVRYGELNRGPGPDTRNTLTPLPQDITSIDLTHRRTFKYGLMRHRPGLPANRQPHHRHHQRPPPPHPMAQLFLMLNGSRQPRRCEAAPRRCEPEGRGNLSTPLRTTTTALLLLLLTTTAQATPLTPPGDPRLRHDIQLLTDTALINRPITTWPLAWGDLLDALDTIDPQSITPQQRTAYNRLRTAANKATGNTTPSLNLAASAASHPRIIRTFQNTPRDDGGITAGLEWTSNRFAANLQATYALSPARRRRTPTGRHLGRRRPRQLDAHRRLAGPLVGPRP